MRYCRLLWCTHLIQKVRAGFIGKRVFKMISEKQKISTYPEEEESTEACFR